MLTLRSATMEDAALLLAWRNDASTRKWFHDTTEVDLASHVAWLGHVLKDPDRQLFIAEFNGAPIGNIRAEFNGEAHELSWTIAPTERGKGLGQLMVLAMVSRLDGAVHAEIKVENDASAKSALFAGLELCGEVDGVLHFRRPALVSLGT